MYLAGPGDIQENKQLKKRRRIVSAKASEGSHHQVNLSNGKEVELEEAEDRGPHLAVGGADAQT